MPTTATPTTHTPGPWVLDRGANGDMLVTSLHESPDDDVCHVYGGNAGDDDRAQADARLIAAAPELLAALLDVLPDLSHYASTHGPGPDRRLAVARAAIAKATGQGA
jgi:hypothetical protein